jgi:anaphase-promoting complex subunit 5
VPLPQYFTKDTVVQPLLQVLRYLSLGRNDELPFGNTIMARYLTPSKIALLTLIVLYTEDVVPVSEVVSVLSFLSSQIITDRYKSSHQPLNPDASYVTKIEDFEMALASLSSAVPGRTLWDLFLKKLWSIDCSHALDQLTSHALSQVTKSREQLQREREEGIPPEPSGRIARTSPLGAFVRRTHLEYTRLQFSDAATLWQKYILYRKPTSVAFEKKNPLDGKSSLDVNLSDLQLDSSHPIAQMLYGGLDDVDGEVEGFTSTHDVERLMEFQVSELQSKRSLFPWTAFQSELPS